MLFSKFFFSSLVFFDFIMSQNNRERAQQTTFNNESYNLGVSLSRLPLSYGRADKEKIIDYSLPVIVFDWGGVLAHSNYHCLYKFLKKYFQVSSEELANVLCACKLCRNQMSEKVFWQHYALQNKIKLPENWFSDLEKSKLDCLELNEEMFELIRGLKKEKFKVVLFSNVSKEKGELLRKYGFYDIFDETILSYIIGYKKPDPRAYDILLSKIGVKPADCILIDNKKENIKAALEKGISGIIFKSYSDLQSQLILMLQKK